MLRRNPAFRGKPRRSTLPFLHDAGRIQYKELHQTNDSRGKPRWLPPGDDKHMLYDFGIAQITANTDQFSAWLDGSGKEEGRMVCVMPGEHLETLPDPVRKVRWSERDKLQCTAIVMPGEGVVDIAVMQGGTKLRSKTEAGDCKLWMDQIVEKNIYRKQHVRDSAGKLVRDADGNKQLLGQHVQDKLRGIVFQVQHWQFTLACRALVIATLHLRHQASAQACSAAQRAERGRFVAMHTFAAQHKRPSSCLLTPAAALPAMHLSCPGRGACHVCPDQTQWQ